VRYTHKTTRLAVLGVLIGASSLSSAQDVRKLDEPAIKIEYVPLDCPAVSSADEERDQVRESLLRAVLEWVIAPNQQGTTTVCTGLRGRWSSHKPYVIDWKGAGGFGPCVGVVGGSLRHESFSYQNLERVLTGPLRSGIRSTCPRRASSPPDGGTATGQPLGRAQYSEAIECEAAAEQPVAADEVGARRGRLAPPSQLNRVFCGRGPAVEKREEATEEARIANPWLKGSRTWRQEP
jgi:hypothetical protein